MKRMFSNIKLMLHPGVVLATLIFTFMMCFICGWTFGLIIGPVSMYQICFHDKNHRWNGQDWVDKNGKVWKDR